MSTCGRSTRRPTSGRRSGLGPNAPVVRIRRLRHIEDEPFSFTVNYLPVEIGRRIRAKDLCAVPLLKMLQTDLRIPIVRAQETIDADPRRSRGRATAGDSRAAPQSCT